MGLKLTMKKLRAIEEALCARTAGEIDVEDEPSSPRRADYEAALDWASEQIERRKAAKNGGTSNAEIRG